MPKRPIIIEYALIDEHDIDRCIAHEYEILYEGKVRSYGQEPIVPVFLESWIMGRFKVSGFIDIKHEPIPDEWSDPESEWFDGLVYQYLDQGKTTEFHVGFHKNPVYMDYVIYESKVSEDLEDYWRDEDYEWSSINEREFP